MDLARLNIFDFAEISSIFIMLNYRNILKILKQYVDMRNISICIRIRNK